MALLGIIGSPQIVCRVLRETDIQFGDIQDDIMLGKSLGKSANVLGCRFVGNFDVGLRSHASDRNVILLPALDLIHHEASLAALAEAPFDGVVVITKFGIRVGSMSPHESGVEEFGTNRLEPDRAIGTPSMVIIVDSLVHHVPFGDFTLPVPNHIVDMVLKNVKKLFLVANIVHPAGNLAVPSEGMATNAHLVRLGIGNHLIALGVAELAFVGLRRVKLHFVFSNNRIELCLVDFLELRFDSVIEPFAVQDGPNVTAPFFGQTAERFLGKN